MLTIIKYELSPNLSSKLQMTNLITGRDETSNTPPLTQGVSGSVE